ncbi:hypothetical protein HLB23_18785 [Nocardia uniformis]|uniref:Uncharacterized protein n=1 Tax=Nocardia uniformis TaxID=53432 RepID=A0A849C2C7_9NOCA|nr:hypothetical protein [Nocardia uniformis]NNH71878.1 hypothetical protein [Nocardia uniformis]
MIGELLFVLLGTGSGVTIGWIAGAGRTRGAHTAGNTVADIRARIEREDQGRYWLLA